MFLLKILHWHLKYHILTQVESPGPPKTWPPTASVYLLSRLFPLTPIQLVMLLPPLPGIFFPVLCLLSFAPCPITTPSALCLPLTHLSRASGDGGGDCLHSLPSSAQ